MLCVRRTRLNWGIIQLPPCYSMLWMCLTSYGPPYCTEKSINQSINQPNLRAYEVNNFGEFKCRTDYFRNSCFSGVVRKWSSLESNIISLSSIVSFRSKLKQLFLISVTTNFVINPWLTITTLQYLFVIWLFDTKFIITFQYNVSLYMHVFTAVVNLKWVYAPSDHLSPLFCFLYDIYSFVFFRW